MRERLTRALAGASKREKDGNAPLAARAPTLSRADVNLNPRRYYCNGRRLFRRASNYFVT